MLVKLLGSGIAPDHIYIYAVYIYIYTYVLGYTGFVPPSCHGGKRDCASSTWRDMWLLAQCVWEGMKGPRHPLFEEERAKEIFVRIAQIESFSRNPLKVSKPHIATEVEDTSR